MMKRYSVEIDILYQNARTLANLIPCLQGLISQTENQNPVLLEALERTCYVFYFDVL